jgi:putative ABC transport system ATP-binding protein
MATHDPEAAEEADGEIRLDDGQLETIRTPQG